MSDRNDHHDTLRAFEDFLARHGADRTRWPAQERLAFATLLATSAEAKRMCREAEMLDRLLDLVPKRTGDTRALADRIFANVEAEPRAEPARRDQPRATVDAATVVSSTATAIRPPRGTPAEASRRSASDWKVAAVLAASLVIGTLSGASGALDTTVAAVLEGTSLEQTTDTIPDLAAIALGSASASPFEEDTL